MKKSFHFDEEWLRKKVTCNELYFAHTSGVRPLEAEAIFAGIRKLIEEVRSNITIINRGYQHINTHDGKYQNPNWYQEQAAINRDMGFGQQVDGSKVLTLLSEEIWQHPPYQPHMDVMACDKDITGYNKAAGEYADFAYGIMRYPYSLNSVMSVKRFRDTIRDPKLLQAALAVTAAHELGHNFSLVNRNFNQTDKLGSHCNGKSGPCLMEQLDTGGSRNMKENARLFINRQRWLCKDCLEEAAEKREMFINSDLLW